MLYEELRKLAGELEAIMEQQQRALAADTLAVARRRITRSMKLLNIVLLPYRVEQVARSMDRGNTFHEFIRTRDTAPRSITI